MTEFNGSNEPQEVKNAAGETVGHFIPAGAYRKMLDEQERLRHEVAGLRAAFAKVLPSDFFAKLPPDIQVVDPLKFAAACAIFGRKPEELVLTEEELEDLQKNGVPFGEVVDQIIREMGDRD
jgi:hypothetical protein